MWRDECLTNLQFVSHKVITNGIGLNSAGDAFEEKSMQKKGEAGQVLTYMQNYVKNVYLPRRMKSITDSFDGQVAALKEAMKLHGLSLESSKSCPMPSKQKKN